MVVVLGTLTGVVGFFVVVVVVFFVVVVVFLVVVLAVVFLVVVVVFLVVTFRAATFVTLADVVVAFLVVVELFFFVVVAFTARRSKSRVDVLSTSGAVSEKNVGVVGVDGGDNEKVETDGDIGGSGIAGKGPSVC